MDQLATKGQMPAASISTASGTSNDDSLYEDKIKKLATLTQQGKVEWHIVDASTIPTLSFARVLTAYEASFGGETLRLIETGYEQRNMSSLIGGLSSLFSARTNEMSAIALSLYLLDQNGRPTFRFPSVKAIYELLNEIKMKQSNIARFLSAIDNAVDNTEK